MSSIFQEPKRGKIKVVPELDPDSVENLEQFVTNLERQNNAFAKGAAKVLIRHYKELQLEVRKMFPD